MDESLDSEAEARSEGRRPELRAGGPARGPASSNKRRRRRQRKVAAEEWSQLPLFELDELARVFPLSERPLPILSGQDAMTSAGISCSPTCPTAPRRIVFIPTFGRSGTKVPEVPEGSRETSSRLSRTQ